MHDRACPPARRAARGAPAQPRDGAGGAAAGGQDHARARGRAARLAGAIEQALRAVRPEAAHLWATHTGSELDLLLLVRGRRYGVEVKFQDAPRLTPPMRIAREDLGLRRLVVLYPGERRYRLDAHVEVVPLLEFVARGRGLLTGAAPRRGPGARHG